MESKSNKIKNSKVNLLFFSISFPQMHYDILCNIFGQTKFGNKKDLESKLKELGYTEEMVGLSVFIKYYFRVYFGN